MYLQLLKNCGFSFVSRFCPDSFVYVNLQFMLTGQSWTNSHLMRYILKFLKLVIMLRCIKILFIMVLQNFTLRSTNVIEFPLGNNGDTKATTCK